MYLFMSTMWSCSSARLPPICKWSWIFCSYSAMLPALKPTFKRAASYSTNALMRIWLWSRGSCLSKYKIFLANISGYCCLLRSSPRHSCSRSLIRSLISYPDEKLTL
uniref:Uncharacterized protein n=1 Tax=Arundo donax TaxID=35708 RepID=A0A0A9CD69_ARUDO